MKRSIMLLDNSHIELLHERAAAAGVTASWILRALYFSHRDLAVRLAPTRPRRMPSHSSPFSLCWHGDRSAIRRYLGTRELEISSVFRLLLEMYLRGEIEVDLENEKLVKWEHSPRSGHTKRTTFRSRCIIEHQTHSKLFTQADFWPKNPITNQLLARLGQANFKHLRKYGPIRN